MALPTTPAAIVRRDLLPEFPNLKPDRLATKRRQGQCARPRAGGMRFRVGNHGRRRLLDLERRYPQFCLAGSMADPANTRAVAGASVDSQLTPKLG
jgi:hypothetical protein